MSEIEAMKTIPCIVCGKDLFSPYGEENQPAYALEFTTRGHYGSTVVDPMDNTGLAINICDPCLEEARTKGRVIIWQAVGVRRRRDMGLWPALLPVSQGNLPAKEDEGR